MRRGNWGSLRPGLRFFFSSLWVLLIIYSGESRAISLDLVAIGELPSGFTFEGVRWGGISGLVRSGEPDQYLAVSDDRGRYGEPRLFRMKIQLNGKNLKIIPEKNIWLHFAGKKRLPPKEVIDMEGLAISPWGTYLVSSEGDNNQRPRVMPRLFDIKEDGRMVVDFDLPPELLPPRTGHQSSGIRNNRGIEGLTSTPRGRVFAAVESPLVQDRLRFQELAQKSKNETAKKPGLRLTRLIEYQMPEAWMIRPRLQKLYQLEVDPPEQSSLFDRGISEIMAIDEKRLLVTERSVNLKHLPFAFGVEIFIVDWDKTEKIDPIYGLQVLKKSKVLDLNSLVGSVPSMTQIENFEAMAWGPTLVNGRKTVLLVSDDNFMKGQRTQFLLFSLGEIE